MDPELSAAIIFPNLQEIKKRVGLKMDIFFSPKCVLPNPCRIIGFYLLIYVCVCVCVCIYIYIYSTREQLDFGPMSLPKQG